MTPEADPAAPAFIFLVDGRFEPVATCQVTSHYSEIARDCRFTISMQCELFAGGDVSLRLPDYHVLDLISKLTQLLSHDEPFHFSDAGPDSGYSTTEFRVFCPQRLAQRFPCTLSFRTRKFDRHGISSEGSLFQNSVVCEGAIHHAALLRDGAQTLRERLLRLVNFAP